MRKASGVRTSPSLDVGWTTDEADGRKTTDRLFTCGEADRSSRGQFFFLSSPDPSKDGLNSVTYMTHHDSHDSLRLI